MYIHFLFAFFQAYTNAMQTQWAWLLQLSMCLETHMRHAASYHQFYERGRDAERWLNSQTEKMNTYFNREQVTLDDGERYLREIQVGISLL